MKGTNEMSAPLRIVAARPATEAQTPAVNLGEQVRRLQAEAQRLADEHVAALQASLAQTQRLADEIASGGDLYPPGVRDIARRLGEDSDSRAHNLEVLMGRLRGR